MDDLHDVLIIGGGPAGLSAALYTARAGLRPTVFAGSPPGGQLMLTAEVENFPGVPSILGPHLVETLRKQAGAFGTKVINENITSVNFSKKPFELTAVKLKYYTKAVIIATGAQALWLGLASEQKLRGKGISACATCDGFFFKDKIVAVVGGGDTALEEAQTLTRFAKKVYIIHRRDSFRASKIMQDRIMNDSKINIIWNAAVEEVLGEQKVEGVVLKIRNKKVNTRNLKIDGLFVAIGHKPDTQVFLNTVKLDAKGYILTTAMAGISLIKNKIHDSTSMRNKGTEERENSTQTQEALIGAFNGNYQTMTSVPGIFSAGDCVDFAYRQAGTAAGMGIAAALDVERWLSEQS